MHKPVTYRTEADGGLLFDATVRVPSVVSRTRLSLGRCVVVGAAVVALTLAASATPLAWGADEILPVGDEDVLLGDADDYESAACVDVGSCYDEIAEWQEIEERELTADDAEYFVLLAKVNRVFLGALEAVAEDQEIDLVVRHTSDLAQDEELVNITSAVIEKQQEAAAAEADDEDEDAAAGEVG